MASVTFSPSGSQLDSDPIADIQLNVGDSFVATFELDTSGLDANLQSLDLQVDQDLAEVSLNALRTDFDRTTFPDFNFGGSPQEDVFSAIFERRGDPGALPDTINIIVEGEITALTPIANDGRPDIGVTVVKAIDANGKDVTDLFQPSNQAIDVQPFPVVSIGLEPIFIIEAGEPQTVTFSLTEPAPPGGLVVETLMTDSDLQEDTIPNLEQAQNIVNAEVSVENNRAIARFTIAEGATEASIDFAAFEDDLAEGNETFSLTLLPQDGYNLDSDNNSVTSVIVDADIVVNGTSGDDLLNGTVEVEALFGNEGNDVIFGNGGEDALFGGEGRDLITGSINNGILDGGYDRDRLLGDACGGDLLFGGNNRDTLIGGSDGDLLNGGEASDRLIGVDLSNNKPGLNEEDTLTGDSGGDTFVLGNEAGIFYDDGNKFAAGDGDFARITDLNTEEDRIQLFGFAEQYRLELLPNSEGNIDARLIYDSGIDSDAETIALLENVAPDLSIEDPVFTFI